MDNAGCTYDLVGRFLFGASLMNGFRKTGLKINHAD